MIKTVAPSYPFLNKYIDCFYVYNGAPESKYSYAAFPHFNTGLSFIKGAAIQRWQSRVEISENINTGVQIEILGKYTSPVLIEYHGKVREISIVFKPLGLNRFIRDNYQSIAPEFSQEFTNQIWRHFAENLFSGADDIPKLESFLLSQFSENQDLNTIEESLKILHNSNDQTSVSELANKLGYNLKTFHRLFKKHMACTPIVYRRICRFRNSLNNRMNSTNSKNLTEITYDGGYFDQSYLIKEFRKLTNHNPKDFFKLVKKEDGDKIIWEIK